MITLRDLRLSYGERVLFAGVGGTIGPRDRIGLVGANGSGKSTLLRVLMGQVAPDSGGVDKPAFATVGYLPQEETVAAGRSILMEAEAAFEDLMVVRGRLAEAEQRLAALPSGAPEVAETVTLIGELEHRLQDLEPSRLRAQAEAVLTGLGFAPAELGRDCGELSGGWQMRVALARLLLRQPALLLLDEPTNHLDLPSQRWLERFLAGYDGALVVVSHDEAFLNLLCTRTWALRFGHLEDYAGNYAFFRRESVARREQRQQAWKNQQRDLARQQEFIDRFRYQASKARQVQSRIKALERIDRIELEEDEAAIQFAFPEPPRSGQIVLELAGVTKRYDEGGDPIFAGLDLRIERGEKWAVVGPNGAGKSTLVRILAGAEPFESGERRLGYNVTVSWFAQHQSRELDPARSVLETAESAAEGYSTAQVRSLLGAFLFRDDDVFKRVSVLSGGEKNRLALARMLMQPANLLILDEPTNHLDMRSKAVLQQALAGFAGTVVVVSHDRAFLDGFVTKVLEVRPGTRRIFPGTVSEYLERVEANADGPKKPGAAAGDGAAAETELDPRVRRRLAAERRRELMPLRERIAALEKRIAEGEVRRTELEQAMADPEFFRRGEETRRRMDEYERLKADLAEAYEAWTSASEELTARESAPLGAE